LKATATVDEDLGLCGRSLELAAPWRGGLLRHRRVCSAGSSNPVKT
jgi:hypothetical protein